MDNLKWILGTLLFITVLAFTNPDASAHRAKVRDVVMENASREIGETDAKNTFQALGQSIGMQMGVNIINKAVTVDNFYLFSLTQMNTRYESRTVGLGILGKVFLFEKFDGKR